MKKAVGIIIAVLMSLGISILIYAHCHDTLSCEKVVEHVCKGGYKWDKPDHNTVNYKVNPTYSGQPNMLEDAKAAGNKWKNTSYRSRKIAFRPTYDGTTTKKPGGPGEGTSIVTPDGVNVVGWRGLGQNSNIYGASIKWLYQGTKIIKENDLALNYYKKWKKHGQQLTGSYHCMRNTLTHEFGHFAGLRDVYTTQCSEYAHYTMNGATAQNHDKISLECEDKYALHYKYGYIP